MNFVMRQFQPIDAVKCRKDSRPLSVIVGRHTFDALRSIDYNRSRELSTKMVFYYFVVVPRQGISVPRLWITALRYLEGGH